MNVIAKYIEKYDAVLFFIATGLIIGVLVVNSIMAAVFLVLAALIVVVVPKQPLTALAIFILLVPFSNTELFRNPVLNVPGSKPLQILAMYVVVVVFLNYKHAYKIPRYAQIFIGLILTLFTISILRSLDYLNIINLFRVEQFTTIQYIFSDYIKPLIYFIPLLVTLKFVENSKHLHFLSNIIVYSIAILSLYFLYTYIFDVPNKTNFEYSVEIISEALGLHRNALATFYIIGFPFVLARYYINKDLLSIAILGISVIAIGFTYSRTVYITLVLTFIVYLIISKRAKFLPIIIILFVGLSFVISSTIVERASRGFDTGSANEISAGRIDKIWLPIFKEYSENPQNILIGNGKYGMLTTHTGIKGALEGATHPHNMYLEQILDTGLIGMIIFLSFFLVVLLKSYKSLKYKENKEVTEYLYAICVSIISFLLAGISGRSFFPELSNSYIWMVLGMGIVIPQMLQESASRQKV